MPVESTVVPGTGKLKLTGSLGDVSASQLKFIITLRT
jgi:ATP-dependent Lon protease